MDDRPTPLETAIMIGALSVIMGFFAVLAIPAFTVSVCSKVYDIWQEWNPKKSDIDEIV
jgi:hypothetical protein